MGAPKNAALCRAHRGINRRALLAVNHHFEAQGEVKHARFIVSRFNRAFLRVNETQRALVVATGKNSALISVDGETRTRNAQLRRMSGARFMPVPGDIVLVRILEDEQALVERVEPRTFTLERRSAAGRAKTMAANVDLIVTVTALANPPPRLVTLDQLLAFAEVEEIAAAVILTKPDLGDPVQSRALEKLYGDLGYPAAVINPKTNENLDALRELIRGRRALLVGNSGVGKSTIFRALGGETAVGEVSRHGLGRQTTTAGRLYRLGSGFLIDSPGINEFGLGEIAAGDLAQAFRELRGLTPRCRFTDCTHLLEPDCAVSAAVSQGRIASSRYASYRKILLEPT
jgi:ribosome biogenesis GTPase / thiamine phosphate phosphatase